MNKRFAHGVTLLELIVVLVIIAILSTVAVGVYTKEVLRAKITRTRAEIRTLEVAINRYQIDTGQFPPSSTGTSLAPNPLNPVAPFRGSGYLQVALRASLNGNSSVPLNLRWIGPYIDWDENRFGTLTAAPITGSTSPAEIQFLDPFFTPYHYIRSEDYATLGGTFLPLTNPYAATETYYNASTFQLISFGPNATSNLTPNQLGTDNDDITNWTGPMY
ncbi:MAG: prepilin-type N-terminal cleavage/methylation domain-containing protein [Candidatus Sumerlaeia bacterium]|nr:prepilin-type N-terminal cleavage/methylation domain-containing protein [Candidatus Sumerlaeia bacterium]